MAEGKVKASKAKVLLPPEPAGGTDGHFHVYVYDVFNKAFQGCKSFDTVERAVQYQRHQQERIYLDQEADPELFDLPFISADPRLLERIEQDAQYKASLIRDLEGEARQRARKR